MSILLILGKSESVRHCICPSHQCYPVNEPVLTKLYEQSTIADHLMFLSS